jgi:hypothetical protein
VQSWIAHLYIGGVALIALCVVWLAVRFHHTAFNHDDWRVLAEFATKPFWEWLVAPQNGHIMPATLAIFRADYLFLHGEAHLLVAASLLFAFAATVVLLVAHRTGRESSTPLDRTVLAFMAFLLLWAGSLHSFLWGLANVNLLTTLWCFLAVTCLIRWIDHERGSRGSAPWLLASACAAAFAATFSFGTGLAIWGALLAIAIAARLPARAVVPLAGAAAGSMAMYAVILRLLGTKPTPAFPGPGDLVPLLTFTSGFVGSAVGWTLEGLGLVDRKGVYGASVFVGSFALLGFGAFALRALLRPGAMDSRRLLGLGLMTVAVLAGTIAGVARFRFLPLNAVDVRFVIWSAFFWMGAACALAAFPAFSRGRRRATLALVALPLASVLMLPAVGNRLQRHFVRRRLVANASLSLLLEIDSEWIATKLSLEAQVAPLAVDLLKRDERGPFSDPRRAWVARPLAVEPRTANPARCAGRTGQIAPVRGAPGDVSVSGWAWDQERDEAPASVVIADSDGIVRGLGDLEWEGPASWLSAREGNTWRGFIAGFDKAERYMAWVVLSDGSFCRLGPLPSTRGRRKVGP